MHACMHVCMSIYSGKNELIMVVAAVGGVEMQKEGKRDHQTDEEASMPMHVHIMGDTDEAVEVNWG